MSDTFTPRLSLTLCDFNISPWHDKVNNNFRTIDAALYSILGLANIKGAYVNSTAVTTGEKYFDANTSVFYEVVTSYVTMPAPTTFAQDRVANPTKWKVLEVATIAGAVGIVLDAQTACNAFAAAASASASAAAASAASCAAALASINSGLSGAVGINPNLLTWKINGTSVTATADQINVLATIPNTLTGTELGYVDGVTGPIQTQLNSKRASAAVTVVTAGTNAQGQGALTTELNVVTVTAANPSGVTLPVPAAGSFIRVINRGTNPINVYPPSGCFIGALAVNVPVSVPVGVAIDLFGRDATRWEGYATQPRSSNLDALSSGQFTKLADTIVANINDNSYPSNAALDAYIPVKLNAGGSAPIFACRAWGQVSFPNTAGTYSRTGSTVTVTMTGHGMISGQGVYLDFTTGTATDGYYIVTVVDANTFTVNDTISGATSGNVSRLVWVKAGGNIASIIKNATGDFTINFTIALQDAFFAINGTPGNTTGADWTYNPTVYTASSVRGVVRNGTNGPSDPEFFNFSVFR